MINRNTLLGNIALAVIIVLVAVGSFGLGRLSVQKGENGTLTITTEDTSKTQK